MGTGGKGRKRRGGSGVGHVSGCGGLGIEVRKVRDGASKGQGWRVERWRFVVGNGVFGRWRVGLSTVSG